MPVLSAFESKPGINIKDVALRSPEKSNELTLADLVTPELINAINSFMEKHNQSEGFYLETRSGLSLMAQAVGIDIPLFTLPFDRIKRMINDITFENPNNNVEAMIYLSQARTIYGDAISEINASTLGQLHLFGKDKKDDFMIHHWEDDDIEVLTHALVAFISLRPSFNMSSTNRELLIARAQLLEGGLRAEYFARIRLLDPTFRVDKNELQELLSLIEVEGNFQKNPHWYVDLLANLAILSAETVEITKDGIRLTPSEHTKASLPQDNAPPLQRSF